MNQEAEEGGGVERKARQKEKGKRTARERIDLLFDPGSFQEFDIEDPEARQSVKGQYKILLSRWNPLTPDTQIAVNPDWVISISEPMMSIVESYIKMTQPEETTLTETEVVDK